MVINYVSKSWELILPSSTDIHTLDLPGPAKNTETVAKTTGLDQDSQA